MTDTLDETYVARSTFQHDLDLRFPQGAVCAILPVRDGRLQAAGRVETTGRLLCTGARLTDAGWEHEILIDTRIRADRPATELRLWIGPLVRHDRVAGLWQAEVRDGGDERILRLNSAAPPSAMPRPAGRTAVTRAHEDALFPGGIPA